MNLICKFNFDDSAESKKNNLSKYDGIPGVWALRGKDKRADADEQEGKWICLQVGQTQDIKIEIEKDIKDMEKSRKVITESKYVNYFGEAIFAYPKMRSGNSYLYKWIVDNYKGLEFILIKKEDNENNRKIIEKLFACITKAMGWRNGRSFWEDCYSEERCKNVKEEQEELERKLIQDKILSEEEIKGIKRIIKEQFLTSENSKYHDYVEDIPSEYSDYKAFVKGTTK